MTPRDEARKEIATWQAELNGLPQLNTFEVHDWGNKVESARIQGLSVNDFAKEFVAAEQKEHAEQKRVKTLELLRDRMGRERGRLRTFIDDQTRLLQGPLLPANLAEVITRLEGDIKGDEATLLTREQEIARIEWRHRDTVAHEKQGWNMRPNSPAIAIELDEAKARCTPLRARLTRTRAALSQLRALILGAADSEVAPALRRVLTELHESNMASDIGAMESAALAPPTPQTEAQYLKAHGVTHDTEFAEIE